MNKIFLVIVIFCLYGCDDSVSKSDQQFSGNNISIDTQSEKNVNTETLTNLNECELGMVDDVETLGDGLFRYVLSEQDCISFEEPSSVQRKELPIVSLTELPEGIQISDSVKIFASGYTTFVFGITNNSLDLYCSVKIEGLLLKDEHDNILHDLGLSFLSGSSGESVRKNNYLSSTCIAPGQTLNYVDIIFEEFNIDDVYKIEIVDWDFSLGEYDDSVDLVPIKLEWNGGTLVYSFNNNSLSPIYFEETYPKSLYFDEQGYVVGLLYLENDELSIAPNGDFNLIGDYPYAWLYSEVATITVSTKWKYVTTE